MDSRPIRTVVAIGVVLAAVLLAAPATAQPHERFRFKSDLQTTSRLVPVSGHQCDDETGHAPVVAVQQVTGAGDASLLGPVVDEQSHCIRADLTFFNGHFTITNAQGRTIVGRYFGQLVPTFNSTFPPNAPPGGPWFIFGNVCIEGGTVGRIENDCAADRYQPARGITNLDSGDATIFIDQLIDAH